LKDICWSQVLANQITGRAHRRGQTKTVKVFHIVALYTTDVLMSEVARAKGEMLMAFVARQPGKISCFP
jgi:SNF2 family DNA or RNA helicase